jgi:hypothetical protein
MDRVRQLAIRPPSPTSAVSLHNASTPSNRRHALQAAATRRGTGEIWQKGGRSWPAGPVPASSGRHRRQLAMGQSGSELPGQTRSNVTYTFLNFGRPTSPTCTPGQRPVTTGGCPAEPRFLERATDVETPTSFFDSARRPYLSPYVLVRAVPASYPPALGCFRTIPEVPIGLGSRSGEPNAGPAAFASVSHRESIASRLLSVAGLGQFLPWRWDLNDLVCGFFGGQGQGPTGVESLSLLSLTACHTPRGHRPAVIELNLKYLGIATCQWLRMRLGVDTVKPDVHTHNFVKHAVRTADTIAPSNGSSPPHPPPKPWLSPRPATVHCDGLRRAAG